jgi:hypothetical protein
MPSSPTPSHSSAVTCSAPFLLRSTRKGGGGGLRRSTRHDAAPGAVEPSWPRSPADQVGALLAHQAGADVHAPDPLRLLPRRTQGARRRHAVRPSQARPGTCVRLFFFG